MGKLVTGLVERLRSMDSAHPVPSWVAPAFFLIAILLLPWIAWLFLSLPDKATAANWRFAWGGFDVGLACALITTAILIVRRSLLTQIAASVTGTMIVCDAWFDVLTSHGTTNVAIAAVLAVAAELPLAAFCFWIAWSVQRVVEEALPEVR